MADNKAQETQKMQSEISAAFEQADAADNTETIKTPVLSFSGNNIYLGLKLVSTFDEKTKTRREPVPKITASFNGHFVETPLNGNWWRSFADFVGKMADALEGVDLASSTVNGDVDNAKSLMAKYRTK